MFESVVASILNRYLGKYVEELDLENLNIGIFNGNVVLEDLKLKPEALYELGLPIYVKSGTIGKLKLKIPWSRICNQTSVITIEEVSILAIPITAGKFECDIEKRVDRAEKRRILNELDADVSLLPNESPHNFTQTLIMSVLSSLRVYIHSVHIRYEDNFTDSNIPIAVGLCIYSLSMENTNSKWKPISHSSKIGSIYQIVKIESFSLYCNVSRRGMFTKKETISSVANNTWVQCMKQSLETFSINGEAFDFLLKPMSIRLKIIINKSNEARILKLSVDFKLQDAALQLSHQQYMGLMLLVKSFHRIAVNRVHRKFKPEVPVRRNARLWWRYAYNSIVERHYKPYTWSRLHNHRKNYANYCDLYRKMLLEPANTEVKIDLQRAEDILDIYNIIIAQEETKIKMREMYPEKITPKKYPSRKWFWFPVADSNYKQLRLSINNRKNGFWNRLSSNEKNFLFEMIGYSGCEHAGDKSEESLERKLNLTVANLSLSLLSGGRETLVIGISHLQSNIKTRPAVKAYKISTRIESLVVEGASVEYGLIPIVTSANVIGGDSNTNLFSFDFEKNPLNNEVNYSLSIQSESLEIIYHEFSMSSFSSFIQTRSFNLESAVATIFLMTKRHINQMTSNMLSRHCMFQISIDMKLPHFVVPEHGSLQCAGNTLIVDFGRIKIWSDLQFDGLCWEDPTQLELKEKSFNRFHVNLVDFQMLLFSPGQDWRCFKKTMRISHHHILSRIQAQVVLSSNIERKNKQLPRYILNVSSQTLKLNLSDSRIINLLNFIENLPRPKSHTVLEIDQDYLLMEELGSRQKSRHFEMIQFALISMKIIHQEKQSKEERKFSNFHLERAASSVGVSDEYSNLRTPIFGFPGFDSFNCNLSPNHNIIHLFGIDITQIILELRRSCNNVDKPYLVLQFDNFRCDVATMEYDGLAVQISLKSLNILDKLHGSMSSNQVQLLSTVAKTNVLTMLYRKVRSDSPDFESYYRGMEHSLVVDVNTLQIIMHREASVHLYRYLQYCAKKFDNSSINKVKNYFKKVSHLAYDTWFTDNTFVLPEVTKFCYSARVHDVELQLCDTEIEFFLIKLSGFELEYSLEANDKFMFRAFLHSLSMDDRSNTTLYSKIICAEKDKLLEVKYVRNPPRKGTGMNTDSSNGYIIRSDGDFNFFFGRIHLVLMDKFVHDVKNFFRPFISSRTVICGMHRLKHNFLGVFSSYKINLSIDFRLPVLLLPQRASSPYLIMFNTGELVTENFFKELFMDDECGSKPYSIIDNMMIRIDAISVTRAVINLNGSISVQETILEPVRCRMDVKRVMDCQSVNELSLTSVNIDLCVEKLTFNLGQRDFGSFHSIWKKNVKKFINYCHIRKDVLSQDENDLHRLPAFFYQRESDEKEAVIHINFEGLTFRLCTDVEEVINSPMRNENRSICKFKMGEVVFNGFRYTNGKVLYQICIQSLLLEDTRLNCDVNVKKIFQSYGATNTPSNTEKVCITVPPVVTVTLNRSQGGERQCDILIDHTRLNLGTSFLTDFLKFFVEVPPNGQTKYSHANEIMEMDHEDLNDENLEDEQSSYSFLKDRGGLTLSVECRRPEIMFFSTTDDFSKNHALLLRSDVSIEFIRNPANVNFTCHIKDVHLLSKLQSKLIKTVSNVVLQPCNVEIFIHRSSVNKETKISMISDKIDMHISSSTIHTISNFVRELDSSLLFTTSSQSEKCDFSENIFQDFDNLWTPKDVPPYHLIQNRDSNIEQRNSEIQSEVMILSLPIVNVLFEIEDIVQKKPVLLFNMRTEAKFKNWSSSLEVRGDFSLQCSHFNYSVNAWEPVIEPYVKQDNVHCPWELTLKAFKSKSYPIPTILGRERNLISRKKSGSTLTKVSSRSNFKSETSTDEEEESSMKSHETRKTSSFTSYAGPSGFSLSDSGSSDDEDVVVEKLKCRVGQLLTEESSDENLDSDSDISMDEQSIKDMTHVHENSYDKRAVFITEQGESIDSGQNSQNNDKSTLYIILEAQEKLDLVLTPSLLSVVKQILDSFSFEFNNTLADTQFLLLRNDIAPHSTVCLRTKTTIGGTKTLMSVNYSSNDSSPVSSRNSTTGTPSNFDHLSDLEFSSGIETFEGDFAPDPYSKIETMNRQSDSDVVMNALQFPQTSIDILYRKIMNRYLHIHVPGFEDLTVTCPMRTSNKYHALQPIKNKTQYYLVISVQNDLWGQVIQVRSPLQIRNETCYALGLYYKKNALDGSGFEHIGELTNPFEGTYKFSTIEPDEEYNVPIMVTYHCSIYVLPAYEDYQLSEIGLWWKELANNMTGCLDIICKAKDEKSPAFVTRAVITSGVELSNSSSSSLLPNFRIRLLPSVVLYNLLPCAISIKIPSADFSIRIEAGSKSSVYSLDMNIQHTAHIEIPIYFGCTWTGNFSLHNKLEEKSVSMTTDDEDTDGGNKHTSLNIRLDKSQVQDVSIYSPYWIVNKTGLPIQLKSSASNVIQETFAEEPMVFAYRKIQKKTIRLRIYESSWSSAFSIDTIGCSESVICRDRERNRSYHILVEVSASKLSPRSTKIVTLLPYFLLLNQSGLPIRYMEENERADLWIDFPLNQVIPYWPETTSMKMCIKYKDSSVVSQHFFVNRRCHTVLRMDRGTALVVDVDGGEIDPFFIIIRNYKVGDAPVRIDNFCHDLFLKISQEGSGQVTLLSPYQSLLYTWDDPTRNRQFQWNVYNHKNEEFNVDLRIDDHGQEVVNLELIEKQLSNYSSISKTGNPLSSFGKHQSNNSNESCSSGDEESGKRRNNNHDKRRIKTREEGVVVFWVSYLEGAQRVLLFTQDEQVANYVHSRIDSERSHLEIFVSMKGIGLSLVEDYANNGRRELAYFSATDSASIWEVNIAHSWKILPLELATWIEQQWSQGIMHSQLKDYIKVDLEKMHLIKPFFGELKRSYYPALWIHGRKSLNYYYVQWKIYHFQIDNQLPNSTFETILYPTMVSSDVIRKYGLKPNFEGTILKKKKDKTHEKNVYKYIKLAMLDINIQIDERFLISMYDLIKPWLRPLSPALRIRADICKVHHPLTIKLSDQRQFEKKTAVEYLYLSPIKIKLIFVPSDAVNLMSNDILEETHLKSCLYFILQCIYAKHAHSKEIKLKCSSFEEVGIISNLSTKLKQVRYYYYQNLLKQVYANLLKIDSLMKHEISEINLPEEYVESYNDLSEIPYNKMIDDISDAISESARYLLSHITGPSSISSGPSLITCGKRTSLDLGLNAEVMKKKIMTHRVSFEEPEEVIKGDHHFGIGVFYGLSEIHLNPVHDPHRNGTELFFKTYGKYLLRLLIKYSTTINNVPLAAIDGVQRASETGTNMICKKRLPKYINPFGMRPYSLHQAIGLNISRSMCKGVQVEIDQYWTHIILSQDGKSCLLITLQRIYLMIKFSIWDDWRIQWCILVNDIIEVPQVVDNKLTFKSRQEDVDGNDLRSIEHEDRRVLFWIQKMIEIVFIINLENKPLSFVESQAC